MQTLLQDVLKIQQQKQSKVSEPNKKRSEIVRSADVPRRFFSGLRPRGVRAVRAVWPTAARRTGGVTVKVEFRANAGLRRLRDINADFASARYDETLKPKKLAALIVEHAVTKIERELLATKRREGRRVSYERAA